MATNAYATKEQIKSALRISISDSIDDTLIDNCAGAASRLIDGYCNRKFWAVGSATSRVFQAEETDYVAQHHLVCSVYGHHRWVCRP